MHNYDIFHIGKVFEVWQRDARGGCEKKASFKTETAARNYIKRQGGTLNKIYG